MFRTFEAESADALWQAIANSYRSGGFDAAQQSRAGNTSELLHTALSIEDPRKRWVFSRRPAINVAFALVETVWMLRGRNDAPFLNYFNRALSEYAGNSPTYHGAYGNRLRRSFGLDQLERAYEALKSDHHSRQIVLQIWDPANDLPDSTGNAVSEDVPCNISSLLKIRRGRLEWMQIMRSNDLFRGLPYNFVQFTTLQEVMAGWLGVDLGAYHHVSDSLHVYDDGVHAVRHSLPTLAFTNSDNLALSKVDSDRSLVYLEGMIEKLILPGFAAEQIADDVLTAPLPLGFKNQALIIAAEAARRQGDDDVALTLANACTNPALCCLYTAWLDRIWAGKKLK